MIINSVAIKQHLKFKNSVSDY